MSLEFSNNFKKNFILFLVRDSIKRGCIVRIVERRPISVGPRYLAAKFVARLALRDTLQLHWKPKCKCVASTALLTFISSFWLFLY